MIGNGHAVGVATEIAQHLLAVPRHRQRRYALHGLGTKTHRYFHANPEKVSELGRHGGEAKGPGGARYAERWLLEEALWICD